MKKLQLASLPTPIYRMENFSRELQRNIWIKRDDYTGVEHSGNKVRKLEYLFYDAIESGCDYVFTTGGKQSNHARATAAIAARLGISCILFLIGEDDGENQGNLLLDRVFGAEIIFIPSIHTDKIDEIMNDEAEELSAAGHKAYIMPLGGSTPVGARGYMECMSEIERYEKSEGVHFDIIAHATGSGGTYAGLLVGDDNRNIVGYSASESAEYFVEAIYNIAKELKPGIQKSSIHIVDEYSGPEYGVCPPAAVAFIKHVAEIEGIVMDTCYTGKAFYGLISDINKGKYDDCKDILFIHTGGIFAVFADKAFA